jgi:hypothetical protein
VLAYTPFPPVQQQAQANFLKYALDPHSVISNVTSHSITFEYFLAVSPLLPGRRP